MKLNTVLISLFVLSGSIAGAQSAAAPEDKATKRITITSTKTDEHGKTITETWIAEGTEPAKILEEMALHPDVIRKVELEKSATGESERLFLFRQAGDNVAIEATLDESRSDDVIKEVILIHREDLQQNAPSAMQHREYQIRGHRPKAYVHTYVRDRQTNCAALGVWTVSAPSTKGARINGLIDNGGAQAAGLKEGDVIRQIDEFEVMDYATLHLALSHYRPGEAVTLTYDREGKSQSAKVQLKDWAELPGHEAKSRPDCKENELQKSELLDQAFLDEPSFLPAFQPLILNDVHLYPNPTDGVFAITFSAEPGPLTVSIADVNGKIVFRDHQENTSGQYKKDIDLRDVPQGNYIISVKQNDKVYTQQISRQ